MNGILTLHLDIDIKFRAFGVTIANVSEHVKYPVPPVLQVASPFIGNVLIGKYNAHGVSLLLSISHDAPQVTLPA